MPRRPTVQHRIYSMSLPPELAEYLDAQARRFGVSKAGFIRLLMVQHRESQNTTQSQV